MHWQLPSRHVDYGIQVKKGCGFGYSFKKKRKLKKKLKTITVRQF
jgi:hypothetical protein